LSILSVSFNLRLLVSLTGRQDHCIDNPLCKGLLCLDSAQYLHHMLLLYNNTFEDLGQKVNLEQFFSCKTFT
jgi:hypothetical protein